MGSNGSSLSGTISYKIKEELLNPADIISPNSQLNFCKKGELNISNPSINTKENTCASDDEQIPLIFEWKKPCEKVQITGSFNNWEAVNMQKNPNTGFFEFSTTLSKNVFYFKFIVDDSKWKCSDEYPVKKDNSNNVNNYIDLTTTNDSKKKTCKENNNFVIIEKKSNSDYSCDFPNKKDLDNRAPRTPELLRKEIKLDENSNQNNLLLKGKNSFLDKNNEIATNDCFKKIVNVPHDKLNHLFWSNDYCKVKQYSKCIITQRLKRKLTTIVYYAPK